MKKHSKMSRALRVATGRLEDSDKNDTGKKGKKSKKAERRSNRGARR